MSPEGAEGVGRVDGGVEGGDGGGWRLSSADFGAGMAEFPPYAMGEDGGERGPGERELGLGEEEGPGEVLIMVEGEVRGEHVLEPRLVFVLATFVDASVMTRAAGRPQ
ncbi:hypothetical protein LTR33_016998, partial [Friedmanniomyces endolithicus]